MSDLIVNKVAESGLISLDLEQWYPGQPTALFDIKDHLFMGMIVKEKAFRESLKQTDWSVYNNKAVAITCSADAIIPVWAYMLLASYLQPVCADLYIGTEQELLKHLFLRNIDAADLSSYKDQRVIVKGCGDTPIGEFAYAEITKRLLPLVKTLMYGEPCSTVPVYKKPR
ncbi:MAG: DUF2480 family protein [Chitinophagia bacterium]|jgi:Protein of unknown function (DUF2480)|nr:DUF2480 family protein [Chitinophagia bacterium]